MTTWRCEPREAATFGIVTSAGPVSRGAFVEALAGDPALGAALTETLRGSPHAAFAWELPALSPDTAALDATFALVDSPELARVRPDPAPFAAHLAADASIATFSSLGGDAVLIAPSPRVAPAAAHLAAFLRTAPTEVIDELWSAVGRAAVRRAARRAPVWISTAGLGVHWLHVRLDDRPKYYRSRAFMDPQR